MGGNNGPVPQFAREEVLDAALRLIDRDGLGALTARRLGAELGVSAFTPYNYFDGRDGLLDAIIEYAVPGPAEAVDDDRPWQERLRDALEAVHAELLEHPGALELLMTRSMAEPGLDRWRERIYGVLLSAGFDAGRSAQAGSTLTSLVFGSVVFERFRARQHPVRERKRLLALPAEEFPSLRAIAGEYVHSHTEPTAFALGVASVIVTLETELT